MATSHYSAEESPKDARMPPTPGMEVVFSIPPSSLFLLLQFFLRRPLREIPRLRREGKGLRKYMRKKELGSEEFRSGFFARTLWIFFAS